tara:strand:- start:484 stop:1287 length:804 start_codon:yes stop_codon:yes gene_type:complete
MKIKIKKKEEKFQKKKFLVIFGNDNSKINVSINILKYLNSINNKNNEYYFFNTDTSNKLNKYIKKNLLKINFSNLEKKTKKNEYDWLLSIWSSKIYKKIFLSKFKNNLNLHPSYLPYNRGKDPYTWSIYNSTPIGVSIHEMNSKIDKGKIYLRKKIYLPFPFTAYQVYIKSLSEIKKLFISNWEKIKNKKIKLKKINYNKKLNLRKYYIQHTFLDLDKKNSQNYNYKNFIMKILSCDFNHKNSLQIKINKNIFDTKILMKKSKRNFF